MDETERWTNSELRASMAKMTPIERLCSLFNPTIAVQLLTAENPLLVAENIILEKLRAVDLKDPNAEIPGRSSVADFIAANMTELGFADNEAVTYIAFRVRTNLGGKSSIGVLVRFLHAFHSYSFVSPR